MLTFLKVTDAPIQVPNIFYHTFSFKFLNFSFQIFLLFVMVHAIVNKTYSA